MLLQTLLLLLSPSLAWAASFAVYDDINAGVAQFSPQDIEYWMDEEDYDWEELQEDQREYLASRGWTEEYWDCRSDEESLLDWNQLSEERRRLWITRGWDQARWDNEDPCQVPMRLSTPENFRPLLVDLVVPELESLSMDRLKQEQLVLRTVDGYNRTSEDFNAAMPLGDIVSAAQNGSTDFYLHLEEGMFEKKYLQEKIGDKVVDLLLDAINKNDDIMASGLWKEEWDNLERSDFDWALFLGAKSTQSGMHYDSDIFNLLYVLEGKKRFVMLPNDHRTEGMFETWLNEDGGTGWGSFDLLNSTLPEYAAEVEINAGQALLVPYVCWHAVENLETSLAYSIRVID